MWSLINPVLLSFSFCQTALEDWQLTPFLHFTQWLLVDKIVLVTLCRIYDNHMFDIFMISEEKSR